MEKLNFTLVGGQMIVYNKELIQDDNCGNVTLDFGWLIKQTVIPISIPPHMVNIIVVEKVYNLVIQTYDMSVTGELSEDSDIYRTIRQDTTGIVA